MSQGPIAEVSPRPLGAPLKSKGPVAKVARVLGVQAKDVAWLIGAVYQTAMGWDGRTRQIPPDMQAKLDSLVATPAAIAAARKKAAKRPKPTKAE